jgi:hypothetical protein
VTFVNTRAVLRLRVTQNSVLRRMARPEKVEVTGKWKNWYYVERGDLHSSAGNIIMKK